MNLKFFPCLCSRQAIPLQILEEDSYEKDVLLYLEIGEPYQLGGEVSFRFLESGRQRALRVILTILIKTNDFFFIFFFLVNDVCVCFHFLVKTRQFISTRARVCVSVVFIHSQSQ